MALIEAPSNQILNFKRFSAYIVWLNKDFLYFRGKNHNLSWYLMGYGGLLFIISYIGGEGCPWYSHGTGHPPAIYDKSYTKTITKTIPRILPVYSFSIFDHFFIVFFREDVVPMLCRIVWKIVFTREPFYWNVFGVFWKICEKDWNFNFFFQILEQELKHTIRKIWKFWQNCRGTLRARKSWRKCRNLRLGHPSLSYLF